MKSLFIALTFVLSTTAFAQSIEDQWKYTLRKPTADWYSMQYSADGWKEGFGGFGTRTTPGARVGTRWTTNRIWMRKQFHLNSVPPHAALLIHHDEDATVYLNGTQIVDVDGFTTDYDVIALTDEQRDLLREGNNVLAILCRQSSGGQFIDAHVIDADNVPKLPKPQRSNKPFQSDLITQWGSELTAENAWTEYPRPAMRRKRWTNLNGPWDFAVSPIEQSKTPTQWTDKILVPFALESKLGGVQRLLDDTEALWYRRSFRCDPNPSTRQMLRFEAVDYHTEVFVNGKSVGTHTGGNTPFAFDVSDQVVSGDNELVVRVEDATEGWQLRGKQVLDARGIWYTQVSGIWQTVWLEEVPEVSITDLKINTDASAGSITVKPIASGNAMATVTVKEDDKVISQASAPVNSPINLTIPNAKLWSPANPHLYDIHVSLKDADGTVVDQVDSYAGIRTVGKVKDADGHWRFTLNGEVIFHWGPLDQGWWPDGLLTPPSDEAMLFDIQWLKQAGFNMIRKHIKVEPRRYYYHCDRLGMMVWQDQVSGGVGQAWPAWTRLQPNPVDAQWPDKHHQQFMRELERMIDTLENHPSIVSWVPFNERWGQHRTMKVGKWTVDRDPTRLINIASGGNFWPIGDVVDAHRYPHPEFPFDQGQGGRFDDFIKVMGEFGGHGFPVKGHLWDADRRNWGYGGLPQNESEYKQRYVTSLEMLNELRSQGIAAGVYTQTTDVEGEINGLMTYDRKVIKIPAKELAELHEILFHSP